MTRRCRCSGRRRPGRGPPRTGRPRTWCCSTSSRTCCDALPVWATPSWEVALAHLGHTEAHLEVLDRGFRVPASVISFAARLLPAIAPGMSAPTSVRDDPGSLSIVPVPAAGLWPGALAAVEDALAAEGSIGLIVPDDWVPKAVRA